MFHSLLISILMDTLLVSILFEHNSYIYICIYICMYLIDNRHWFKETYSPLIQIKKIKLIIYCNKFQTSNLVIKNNSSPSIGVLQKTNVIYQFKCPLGDCISENNNICVSLTSTTLSRRLTMHLSIISSIAPNLKKHSCPTTELWKILTENTTILEQQNTKKLQILGSLHIRNIQPKLNRINFETSANVLKCLQLLTLFTETNLKSKCYTIQQYKCSFLLSSNVHKKITSLL